MLLSLLYYSYSLHSLARKPFANYQPLRTMWTEKNGGFNWLCSGRHAPSSTRVPTRDCNFPGNASTLATPASTWRLEAGGGGATRGSRMVCAGESCKPVRVNGSWDLAPSHMRSSLNFNAILNMSDVSRAGLEVSFSLDTFTNGFFSC